MSNKYIQVPESISFNSITNKGYTLSSSQYMDLMMPNDNYKFVKDFLFRDLKRSDLGNEVGSINYIKQSPFYFLRTKSLQSYSFLPDITPASALPVMPNEFINQDLKEGDLLISKDSNIGEIIILDQDYSNYMTSSAIYKLPVKKDKYYLLAFVKHRLFREQLDFMVPKGATIRHAKTKFLDCKIPIPKKDTEKVMKYVSVLTEAIINKEKLIKQRHKEIISTIEREILNNQKKNNFQFTFPHLSDLEKYERLDTSLYSENFSFWNFKVKNYKNGSVNLIERGFDWARGTSLEKKSIKNRIDSNKYLKGFTELILPTNISQYGFVEKQQFIGTSSKLKTIKQGDIIFGGEGFGKGRTYVIIEDSINVVTNYHGIRIYNLNNNLTESIFIRCFLAFWREKGIIDHIGVGGSGGHCSPSYFHLIETPKFQDSKQKEIAKLYHNSKVENKTYKATLDNYLLLDNVFNEEAGIYELDRSAKELKERLNQIIDQIANDKKIEIIFS